MAEKDYASGQSWHVTYDHIGRLIRGVSRPLDAEPMPPEQRGGLHVSDTPPARVDHQRAGGDIGVGSPASGHHYTYRGPAPDAR
ncbi:MAG TPA: hypothetical protein VG013_05630 [Gemmataceae bacterium]|jgi:hypothetical protein|nr:hypothetical protein [Gemmataceae bacterium]